MGGKGSGRPPSAETLIKKSQSNLTPIADDMFIPNHSGDHSKGQVLTTPVNDLDMVNKKYVDDSIDTDIATHEADTTSVHGITDTSLLTTSTNVITDNRLVKGDGGSRGVQETGITCDDSDNLTGVGTIGCGNITMNGTMLELYYGDSGWATAPSGRDLWIESDDDMIMQFVSPNDKGVGIHFGDEDTLSLGAVYYEHSTDTLSFKAGGDVDILELTSGNADINGTLSVTGTASIDGCNAGMGDYVKVSDVKASGTDGGTFTAGAWRTRVLNTEDTDTASICTLSGSQITLAAGTYRCRISAPAMRVNRNKAILYNVSDSSTELIGTSEFADSDSSGSQTRSFISGQFTIASAKTFEVRHD